MPGHHMRPDAALSKRHVRPKRHKRFCGFYQGELRFEGCDLRLAWIAKIASHPEAVFRLLNLSRCHS